MITEQDLATLRREVRERLSDRRFRHTVGVEEAATALAAYLMPQATAELRAAALLHDIAKELPAQEQLSLIREEGLPFSAMEENMPALFHSLAAVPLIRRDFPAYAVPRILSAVRFHTVGAPQMTLFDKIIFIADYVEENRTYPACISARQFLFGGLRRGDTDARELLDRTVLMSIDATVMSLIGREDYIAPDTVFTRNAVLSALSHSYGVQDTSN